MYKFIKLNICVIVLALSSLYCSAQTDCSIVRVYAFSKEIFPGIVRNGMQGNPLTHGPNILNIIYLEISGNEIPKWDSAGKNGNAYNVTVTAINQDTVDLGKTKDNREAFIIISEKGNHLFRLDLSPVKTSDTDSSVTAIQSEGKFILKGKFNRKKMTLKIDQETALAPELRQ